MFTAARISEGSTYLRHHLASNDYYSEKERVTGRWIGQGASLLEIDGREIGPKDEAFENLRNNRLPLDPDAKLTPRDSENRIRFFDFQCSGPKSISILALIAGDERLYAAHDRAANVAFAELERFAGCRVRAGAAAHSRDIQPTGNLCAASFRHDASRALDPQIHTHFVVANATYDPVRGRWLALNEFHMIKAIEYAGRVYQNELAREVQKLGYDLEITRKQGRVYDFQIKGVSPALCQRFSKRRADIEKGIAEFVLEKGREPTPAETHVIATSTRGRKLTEISTAAVRDAQRAQLSSAEHQHLQDLRQTAERQAAQGATPPPHDRETAALAAAVEHLFERKSVAQGHEILATALRENLGDVDLDRLKLRLEQPRKEELSLVPLVPSPENPGLGAAYATQAGLRLELEAVRFVNQTQNQFPPLVEKTTGPFSVPRAPLSTEQRDAVQAVLSQRDQIYALRGAAGAGKTTVLREIHQALTHADHRVFYAAPTAAAAKVLREENQFTNATTVTDFIQNVAKKEDLRGAVLVIDEAGLQSNRQGFEILRIAHANRARVLFVGDSQQHVAVEAGDFLKILETHSRLHTVELLEIRRQRQVDYNRAVRAMATGQVAAGMEVLRELGWITEAKDRYIQEAAHEYVRCRDKQPAPEATLLVAPTWSENDRVTAAIRQELRGHLQNEQTVEVVRSLNWTRAQKSSGKNYAPGLILILNQNHGDVKRGQSLTVERAENERVIARDDRGKVHDLPLRFSQKWDVGQARSIGIAPGDLVQLLANDRKQGLVNGRVLQVEKMGADHSLHCRGGVIVPPNFKQWTHGYAVTSHKAQGRTAERVIVCAEKLDAKSAYVACSRGRESCRVFTPDQERLFAGLPRSADRTAALDLIRGAERSPDSPTLLARVRHWAHALAEDLRHRVQIIREEFQKKQTLEQQPQEQKPSLLRQRLLRRGFGPTPGRDSDHDREVEHEDQGPEL